MGVKEIEARLKIAASFLACCALLIGCSSLSASKVKLPPLSGMIYDRDNKPVPDVSISVGGKFVTTSDIQGHFAVNAPQDGKPMSILAEKKTYEPVSIEIRYSEPTQLLYLSMISARQLTDLAESAIADQDWGGAADYLDRSAVIGGDTAANQFLRAIVLVGREEYRNAEKVLLEIRENGNGSPHVELFLADLYQYRLNEAERAEDCLKRYLFAVYDPDIEARLHEIEGSK